ncbi:MAG TPA: hypothetical protein PKM67_07410 [Kiritimatiellia bacterium]|nr:hypothetical protein [Kiritimatiellia bacterium]
MSNNIELARLAVAGLTAKDRAALLKDLTPAQPTEQRLVRRREAARLLACSVRTIDHYVEKGLLRRVSVPGLSRAIGFRLADVQAVIDGRAA